MTGGPRASLVTFARSVVLLFLTLQVQAGTANYFDMDQVHLSDFKKYALSWEEYQKEYFIGHYNPGGNHFFAYSIKDKVVDWLNPKSPTYMNLDAKTLDFKGYLQGYK